MELEKLNKLREFAGEVQGLTNQIVKNNQFCDQATAIYFGVTSSQGDTILSMPLKGTLSMNELSKIKRVDNSTMTRMINQLIEKGFVYRTTDEKDRRMVLVGLTEKGQKLYSLLKESLENFYKGALDQIKEEERATIIRSLEILNNAISKGMESCNDICANALKNKI